MYKELLKHHLLLLLLLFGCPLTDRDISWGPPTEFPCDIMGASQAQSGPLTFPPLTHSRREERTKEAIFLCPYAALKKLLLLLLYENR